MPRSNTLYFGRRKSDGVFAKKKNGPYYTSFSSLSALKSQITSNWLQKKCNELRNNDYPNHPLHWSEYRREANRLAKGLKDEIYAEYDIIELNIEEYVAEKVKNLLDNSSS